MVLYKELGWSTYEPHPDGAELFQRICDQGKLGDFEALLEASDGEYINEVTVDDLLRFEEDWLVKTLDLDMSDDEDDADDEPLRKLDQSVFDDPNCPPNATCAAVDSDGDAYWYTCNPEDVYAGEYSWGADAAQYIGEYDASDWRNSKIVREKKDV